MVNEISNRRSIRKYSNKEISKTDIIEIIESGIKAPSAKNRQPWKFIVIEGNAKYSMLEAFKQGISREENGEALLPDSKKHLEGAKYTVKIMEQAPVILFVENTLGKGIFTDLTFEESVYNMANIQSISAAIQNMLLTATEKGVGSLWICDIFFAYNELTEWLDSDGNLIAAIALGFPNEEPHARPRKNFNDVVVWKK